MHISIVSQIHEKHNFQFLVFHEKQIFILVIFHENHFFISIVFHEKQVFKTKISPIAHTIEIKI